MQVFSSYCLIFRISVAHHCDSSPMDAIGTVIIAMKLQVNLAGVLERTHLTDKLTAFNGLAAAKVASC